MTLALPFPSRLYVPLAIMLVMWLFGAGLAWHGLGTLREATVSAARERATRDVARHRVEEKRSRELQQEVAARLWQELRQAGYADGEDIPGWSAMLNAASDELGLPELAAKFGPARKNAGWIVRPLHLKIRLRHEDDLSRLLQHARRHARALVILRICRVEATDDAPEISGLDANCDMDWLTIPPEPATP